MGAIIQTIILSRAERNFPYSWLPSRAPPRRLQPGIESAFIQKTLPSGPRNPTLDSAFPLGVGVRAVRKLVVAFFNWKISAFSEKEKKGKKGDYRSCRHWNKIWGQSFHSRSGWPSGLRRCVQVAVSPGGVGSNPTPDIAYVFESV